MPVRRHDLDAARRRPCAARRRSSSSARPVPAATRASVGRQRWLARRCRARSVRTGSFVRRGREGDGVHASMVPRPCAALARAAWSASSGVEQPELLGGVPGQLEALGVVDRSCAVSSPRSARNDRRRGRARPSARRRRRRHGPTRSPPARPARRPGPPRGRGRRASTPASSTSAATNARRGAAPASASIRRSEARAASADAAYSSSSTSSSTYHSRRPGVTAKPVSGAGPIAPESCSAR